MLDRQQSQLVQFLEVFLKSFPLTGHRVSDVFLSGGRHVSYDAPHKTAT